VLSFEAAFFLLITDEDLREESYYWYEDKKVSDDDCNAKCFASELLIVGNTYLFVVPR
jgi:hypothetical protein